MIYKWLKENAFFTAWLLIAVFLRLAPLGIYQFSHDELSALSRTVFPTLGQEIAFGVQYTDTHPFLIQLFLYYWVKLAGFSEVAVKLPFLLCGIGSVWAVYRFAKQWFGLQAALYAQLIVGASFIFVLYSSYARLYAPGVLCSILLVQALFNILFAAKPARKDFVLFGLFCLLCAFNNHLNALFAFTAALSGLFLLPKKRLVPYLLTCLGVVACYLPHLPITLTQLQTGGLGTQDNGWLPPPKATVLLDFLKTLFGTGYVGICILVLALLVAAASLVLRRRLSKKQWLLLVLFLLNYGIIHLYSVFRSPVLQYSVLLFSAPCLLVFFASFHDLLRRRVFYGLAACIALALLVQDIAVKRSLGDVHRQSYETMVQESLSEANDHGGQTVTGVFAAERFFISFYERKYKAPLSYELVSSPVFSSIPGTRAYFAGLPPYRQQLVLGDVSPVLLALAKEQFPVLTGHLQGPFYNVTTLSRSQTPGVADDALIGTYNLFERNGHFTVQSASAPSQGAYAFDATSGEFPFTAKVPFSTLRAREGQWLLAELEFAADPAGISPDDLLCLSINTPDSSKNFFTAAHFTDFMSGSRASHKLYLQVFVGSDSGAWNRGGELACFVWKKQSSSIRLRSLVLKQLDYNPAKWRLWD